MAADDLEIDRDPGLLPPANEGVEQDVGRQSDDPAPPSLRETLDAAVREAREPQTDKPTDDRRDPATGRFLPKAGGVDASAATAVTPSSRGMPSASQSPTSQPEPQAAPSTAPTGPPTSWDAAAKAEYAKLPAAVQQAVVKREAEVSAGFAQYQGLKQHREQLEQVIGPRRQYYANDGVSDLQAIDNIWKWFEALKNSPGESFPALAQMFGVDLSTVSPNAAADPGQTNPEVAALKAELARHAAQLGQVTSTFEQQQTAARRAELAQFANGKPHFEKVRVTMGKLMQAGVAQGLEDAYQQAVKLDPEVSAQIAADEKAAAERKAAEEALTRRGGGNQRRAAVSVRGGSPNGAAGTAQPTSIRDSLVKGFAEARGS